MRSYFTYQKINTPTSSIDTQRKLSRAMRTRGSLANRRFPRPLPRWLALRDDGIFSLMAMGTTVLHAREQFSARNRRSGVVIDSKSILNHGRAVTAIGCMSKDRRGVGGYLRGSKALPPRGEES